MDELEHYTKAQDLVRNARAWYVACIDEDGHFQSLISGDDLSNIELEGFLSFNLKHASHLAANTLTVRDQDEMDEE